MKKGWKICLGILVLIVAFGTGFFVGRVSAKSRMRFCRKRRCMPASCCCMYHHQERRGHHHKMCPPAPRDFNDGYSAPARGKFCGNAPSAALGNVRPDRRIPQVPKNRERGLHIKAREMRDLPRR